MLIFDSFDSVEKARGFSAYVQDNFQQEAHVCDSVEEADEIDPFPFELFPPVVLVARDWRGLGNDAELAREDDVIASVRQFGGRFAGT